MRTTSCPKPVGIPVGVARHREVELAEAGRFTVFGVDRRLAPPIDWSADPIDSHRYRQNLFKLRFLAPLADAYASDGDKTALAEATAILEDFATRQPRRGAETLGEAWTDKVVGDRAALVGYLTLAAGCEGLLDDDVDSEALVELVHQHGEFLSDAERYFPTNHGLFADRGLHLISLYAPYLEESESWRELARVRFEDTLRGRLAEGMWLEHSSAYQFLVIRPLEGFIDLLGGDAELEGLLARMRDAAPWLVEPDGEMTQFGDSNLEPVPPWALEASREQDGMRAFFGAGMAFVRARSAGGGEGYLAVTAGFHNLTHKHADELSFELYDRGRRLVADTGLYAKDEGPERDFVVSPQAHSTLVVDDRDWPIGNSTRDYGSALQAVGNEDGWYAIQARNPLVERQGVEHTRTYLYRPGGVLVLVDRLAARRRHRYDRYVQLAPGIRATVDASGVALGSPGFEGSIATDPGAGIIDTAKGQRHPLTGFTSPDFRELVPRWTVRFRSRGADSVEALALGLGSPGWKAEVPVSSPRRTIITVHHGDRPARQVEITRSGQRLEVDVSPAS